MWVDSGIIKINKIIKKNNCNNELSANNPSQHVVHVVVHHLIEKQNGQSSTYVTARVFSYME